MLRRAIGTTALGFLAASPAVAQTVHMGASIPFEDSDVVTGDVWFGSDGARTFDDELFVYFPGNLDASAGGATATAGASVASDVARTAGPAAAQAGGLVPPGEPVNVNALNEVVYDYANNLRMEIDHERRTVSTRPIVNAPTGGNDILAGAPDDAQQDQLAALGDLLNTFTQDRPDPMADTELVYLDSDGSGQVEINGQRMAVSCDNYQVNQRNGAGGRACLADPSAVPDGGVILSSIRRLPLEGADGNDFAGRVRRLSDTGKIPLWIFNDQLNPPGAPDLPMTVSYDVFGDGSTLGPPGSEVVVGTGGESVEDQIRQAFDQYSWSDR